MINSSTIFSGCDSKYWKLYGISFVKSFNYYNPDINIHIHLINPDDTDIASISMLPCTYSKEFISEIEFDTHYQKILKIISNNEDKEYIKKIHSGLKFFESVEYHTALKLIIRFSLFAMSRFVQLSKLWTGNYPIIAYDIDSICLGKLDIDDILKNSDSATLMNKKGGCTASLVAFNNNSPLLRNWAKKLEQAIIESKVYGYLDQDLFNQLKNQFGVIKIDSKYCKSGNKKGIVITGKGNVKHGENFIEEKNKWNQ